MRWLVTGAGGQLGTDLLSSPDGDEVIGLARADLDVADSQAVFREIADRAPDVVINAAAYTAVDAAETDEDAAFRVNARGPAALAAALAEQGGRLIQISTDYVFSGEAHSPYEIDAETAPRSAYGRTKLGGEQVVRELLPDRSYVVRTAWVYGAHGSNFVKAMVRLEREQQTVRVVSDQRGSPTWSADLARALVELGRSAAPAGIYHCTGTGETTWFEFARAIFEELGADPDRVIPTTSAARRTAAIRPTYSVLSMSRWQEERLRPMMPWRDALRCSLAGICAAVPA